jgi:2-keto-3-deoxy-L-rhamnonate aldolase RhmA
MPVAPNHTKRLLAEGKLAVGVGVRAVQTVDVTLMAKAAGVDFIFIDREHSTIELSRAGEICTAALSIGVTPIVRVPGPEPHHYISLLDSGAQGIVVPHIQSAADAATIVDAQKLPPLGSRSFSRNSALTGFETMPIAEYTTRVNEEGMVIALVEDRESVKNVMDIAAVPHLDVLMIGASDLCADLGIPGQFEDARAVEACTAIIAACKAHNKACGIAGVRSDKLIRHYVGLGVRMVHAGTDAPILVDGFRARSKAVRDMWSGLQ